MEITLPHLTKDSEGTLWVDDSGYRVIDIVRGHLAHGWTAETLHDNHPDLSLAQIHAALAWFYDHEEEMNGEILRREDRANALLAEVTPTSFSARIRAIKRSRH